MADDFVFVAPKSSEERNGENPFDTDSVSRGKKVGPLEWPIVNPSPTWEIRSNIELLCVQHPYVIIYLLDDPGIENKIRPIRESDLNNLGLQSSEAGRLIDCLYELFCFAQRPSNVGSVDEFLAKSRCKYDENVVRKSWQELFGCYPKEQRMEIGDQTMAQVRKEFPTNAWQLKDLGDVFALHALACCLQCRLHILFQFNRSIVSLGVGPKDSQYFQCVIYQRRDQTYKIVHPRQFTDRKSFSVDFVEHGKAGLESFDSVEGFSSLYYYCGEDEHSCECEKARGHLTVSYDVSVPELTVRTGEDNSIDIDGKVSIYDDRTKDFLLSVLHSVTDDVNVDMIEGPFCETFCRDGEDQLNVICHCPIVIRSAPCDGCQYPVEVMQEDIPKCVPRFLGCEEVWTLKQYSNSPYVKMKCNLETVNAALQGQKCMFQGWTRDVCSDVMLPFHDSTQHNQVEWVCAKHAVNWQSGRLWVDLQGDRRTQLQRLGDWQEKIVPDGVQHWSVIWNQNMKTIDNKSRDRFIDNLRERLSKQGKQLRQSIDSFKQQVGQLPLQAVINRIDQVFANTAIDSWEPETMKAILDREIFLRETSTRQFSIEEPIESILEIFDRRAKALKRPRMNFLEHTVCPIVQNAYKDCGICRFVTRADECVICLWSYGNHLLVLVGRGQTNRTDGCTNTYQSLFLYKIERRDCSLFEDRDTCVWKRDYTGTAEILCKCFSACNRTIILGIRESSSKRISFLQLLVHEGIIQQEFDVAETDGIPVSVGFERDGHLWIVSVRDGKYSFSRAKELNQRIGSHVVPMCRIVNIDIGDPFIVTRKEKGDDRSIFTKYPELADHEIQLESVDLSREIVWGQFHGRYGLFYVADGKTKFHVISRESQRLIQHVDSFGKLENVNTLGKVLPFITELVPAFIGGRMFGDGGNIYCVDRNRSCFCPSRVLSDPYMSIQSFYSSLLMHISLHHIEDFLLKYEFPEYKLCPVISGEDSLFVSKCLDEHFGTGLSHFTGSGIWCSMKIMPETRTFCVFVLFRDLIKVSTLESLCHKGISPVSVSSGGRITMSTEHFESRESLLKAFRELVAKCLTIAEFEDLAAETVLSIIMRM